MVIELRKQKTHVKSEFSFLSYGRKSDQPKHSPRKTVRFRPTRRVTSVVVYQTQLILKTHWNPYGVASEQLTSRGH